MIGTQTEYIRIEYSGFTEKTVSLYSPSDFFYDEEEDDYMWVLDEDGNPVYDSDGFPAAWQGMGLSISDDESNTVNPIDMTVSSELIEFEYQDPNAGIM